MAAPLQVNVRRGDDVESRHEVDAVVVDGNGAIVESWGESGRTVMPRSAVKPIQAVPLIASGAAAAFEVSDVELALACASHNGEQAHVDQVLTWLNRIELDATALECGPQNPIHEPAFVELVASGRTGGPEHNNCSGKHTGFLTVCRHLDLPTEGYLAPGHPLHRDHVTPIMEEFCRFDASAQTPVIDGCGIPVWQVPLVDLARGWTRLTAPGPGRKLLAAMMAHPWFVAGTDRSSTDFMTNPLKPVAAKGGAEGVYCAALPEEGTAIALKARDGAFRAADAAMGHILAELGAISPLVDPIHNLAGTLIGAIDVGPANGG